MQPTRCHITSIFENGIKSFAQALPAMLIPLLASGLLQNYWRWILPGIALLLLLLGGYQIWRWRRTWLYTQEDQLVIQSGVFWKKKLAIPFDKINTVDLSRNLIERVFGTCRIQIDTGVTTKSGSEVDLIFKLDDAENIRRQVLALSGQVESLHDDFGSTADADARPVDVGGTLYARADAAPTVAPTADTNAPDKVAKSKAVPRYQAGIREFVLYGLTQNKILKIVAVLFTAYAFLENTIGSRLYEFLEDHLQLLVQEATRQAVGIIILLSLAVTLLFLILANVVTIVITVVRFFNFRASRDGNHIHIEYGLITAKSYTIPIQNIRSVVVQQNLLRQTLRLASVEIVSIGYGDDKNEIALLLPLIARRKVEPWIETLLPEWSSDLECDPAPRRALRRFFYVPLVGFAAIWGGVLFALARLDLHTPWVWLGVAFTLLVLVASRVLHHRHAAIGHDDDLIVMRQGGFTFREYRIAVRAVQSVGTFSHYFVERAGLRTYFIDYHAPAMKTRVNVRFLHEKHLQPLRSLLEKSAAVQESVES